MPEPSLPVASPALPQHIFKKWFPFTRDLTVQMVRHASVTGSDGESSFASWLQSGLCRWPVFQQHPQNLWLLPTLCDHRDRPILFALVRGQGTETVVLTGHYDVVGTENYGHLSPLAFEPDLLRDALLEEDIPANVRQDLLRGFLPGRGVLDMKSGLAAGLAVMQSWNPEQMGNLLFIGVPDEEETSMGMRSAVQHLPGILQEHGLTLKACINLDATTDPQDGERGQAIFLGSVGKMLPFVWVQGRPAHSGAPVDGINAAFLSSELTSLLEWNPEFGDHEPDPAPPITVLYQSEIRPRYDVTTPAQAWTVFNVLTHHRSPLEVLDSLQEACKTSFSAALQKLSQRRPDFRLLEGPPVLTFEALVEEASSRDPDGVKAMLGTPSQDDPRALSQERCTRLVQMARLSGVVYVVGFAPPFYPTVLPENADGIRPLLQEVQAGLQELGLAVTLRDFYPGISDMSFLAPTLQKTDFAHWQSNAATPESWSIPDVQLDCPVINVGPWGRDYHQKWERVHQDYTFGWLPEVLDQTCRKLLKNPTP